MVKVNIILRYSPLTTSKVYYIAMQKFFGKIPPVRINIEEKRIKKRLEIIVVDKVPTFVFRKLGDIISITSVPLKNEVILGTYVDSIDQLIVSKDLFINKLANEYGKMFFRHEVAHVLAVQPLMSLSYLLAPNYGLNTIELYEKILEGIYRFSGGLEYFGIKDPYLKIKGNTFSHALEWAFLNLFSLVRDSKRHMMLKNEFLDVMKKIDYISTEDETLKSLADWWYTNIKKRFRRKYK